MTRKMSLKAGIPLFYAFLRTMSTGRGHAGLCNTHCLVYVDLVSERVMFSIFYFFPYNIFIDSLGILHHTPQSHSFPRLSVSAPGLVTTLL